MQSIFTIALCRWVYRNKSDQSIQWKIIICQKTHFAWYTTHMFHIHSGKWNRRWTKCVKWKCLMHRTQSFYEFNLIACDLAMVFNEKLGNTLYDIYVAHSSTNFSLSISFFQHSTKITFQFGSWSSIFSMSKSLLRTFVCSCTFVSEYTIFRISKTKGFWMIDYSFRSAFQSPVGNKEAIAVTKANVIGVKKFNWIQRW